MSFFRYILIYIDRVKSIIMDLILVSFSVRLDSIRV